MNVAGQTMFYDKIYELLSKMIKNLNESLWDQITSTAVALIAYKI